ncbi:MAG TPA: M1 family metallopeptidase [Fimbriimonas sp.]|nr:M1 family metallopeptidase [Fimbriimonas sp.]
MLPLTLLVAALPQIQATTSGGALRFEQAVYDVQSYDVSIRANPERKTISGVTVMTAKAVVPSNVILLDLDEPYQVSAVRDGAGKALRYERGKDTIRIWFPMTKQVGEEIKTSVEYAGSPRVAPNPPWIGGFMWSKTPSGAPWISVALQMDGADLLYPCKDHPSDKPSMAAMHITVPDPLIAVGPGKFEGSRKNSDGTSTYDWKMTNPIPNYSIVFNAAPYKLVEDTAKSVAGGTIPIKFYVLPEDAAKAPLLLLELKKYLAFMEKYVGPYPFRSQKLGLVETPHLGMEHSTAIAYGNQFRFGADGLDWLLLHEFGHEWWANLVTASDWRDFWIHEGFQTYMDTLYQEHLGKPDAYFSAMRAKVRGLGNRLPVAPRAITAANELYNGDIYDKGALVLHSLRYLIGDGAFFRSLRRMAYPTPAMEALTDGRQTRLVTTDDFLTIAEEESGQKLGWFFDVYLRQPKLPRLVSSVSGDTLNLTWETPDNLPFPMPADVVVDGKATRLPMIGGKGSIHFSGAAPTIDPKGWVLRAP